MAICVAYHASERILLRWRLLSSVQIRHVEHLWNWDECPQNVIDIRVVRVPIQVECQNLGMVLCQVVDGIWFMFDIFRLVRNDAAFQLALELGFEGFKELSSDCLHGLLFLVAAAIHWWNSNSVVDVSFEPVFFWLIRKHIKLFQCLRHEHRLEEHVLFQINDARLLAARTLVDLLMLDEVFVMDEAGYSLFTIAANSCQLWDNAFSLRLLALPFILQLVRRCAARLGPGVHAS